MQILQQQLVGLPVISLQTSTSLAVTNRLVIDPARLAIAGLLCQAGRQTLLLLPQDIRQLSPQGVLVDSDESLADPPDVIRVAPLVENAFELAGIRVITDVGRAVGRVETYTINPEDFLVQKLHVRRPVWQSLMGASAVVDRQQVVDVTPKQVVVKDTVLPAANPLAQPID